MKVVIVEDEKYAAEKLGKTLAEINPLVSVIQILESVEDAVNWFNANEQPDLIFMDIQLDDGISFEIFEHATIESPIIFTTAYDEYAIRAFKVNSVDYLLKPFEKEALKKSLEKFRKIYAPEISIEKKIEQVFNQLSKKYKTRFFIKIGNKFHSVPVAKISCFFVEERNTFLQTETGKTYDLDYSLDQLQKMVDPEKFFRINRNFFININYIHEIVSYSSNRLKVKLENFSNPETIVSRDKVSEFKTWMDK